MNLVWIPAGEFLMGSPGSDSSARSDEKPQHRVRITRPFYLGTTEVTQEQYPAVTGTKPSHFNASGGSPVENVSWDEAIAFCNRLSERDGLRPYYRSGAVLEQYGTGYRLPTEAEWEYACPAGTSTQYAFGDDPLGLDRFAWFGGNSGGSTHVVGKKQSNAFGLFDMHGNVREWCEDRYDREYYGQTPRADPTGPSLPLTNVYRGGSWLSDPVDCRSANRDWYGPAALDNYLGFRVARFPSDRVCW
jgi:formylglycine-generating enzyme required for sulfatase activity